MALNVGGYTQRPDWPKLGPALLIATALIVAVRTARWPAENTDNLSQPDLDREISYAARVAGSVLRTLVTLQPTLFPRAREPWFTPDEHDVPK